MQTKCGKESNQSCRERHRLGLCRFLNQKQRSGKYRLMNNILLGLGTILFSTGFVLANGAPATGGIDPTDQIQFVERYGSFGLLVIGGLVVVWGLYRGVPSAFTLIIDYLNHQRAVLSEERIAFISTIAEERNHRDELRDKMFTQLDKNNSAVIAALEKQTVVLQNLTDQIKEQHSSQK